MEKDMDKNLQQFENLPPGMLSSPQIRQYIKAGWLIALPDGEDIDSNGCLNSATYDMRLDNWAARFENGKKIKFKIKDELILLPNEITFVTIYEDFRLPQDVIARFNLKSKLVHKGLLLGTGPIVDPEFQGKILIPIHNFNSEEIVLKLHEKFISVEFTKTQNAYQEGYVYNKNNIGDVETYFDKIGVVESSVFSSLQKIRKQTEKVEKIITLSKWFGPAAAITIALSILSIICSVNSRIDNIHSLYNSENYKEFKNIITYFDELKKEPIIQLLKEEIEKLKYDLNNCKSSKNTKSDLNSEICGKE